MKLNYTRVCESLQKTKDDMEDMMESTEMRLHEMKTTLAAEVKRRQFVEAELLKFVPLE
jgi:hypothetical protein